ncbi:MAG: tetratricopeptide repeat protein [Bdellovibrionota bacterium]
MLKRHLGSYPSLLSFLILATSSQALEINWKSVNQKKKVDASVNSERVFNRERVRFTQKVTFKRAPLFNRNDLELETARLQRIDQKTEQLIGQIQNLIKREKQRARVGELKMRLAELYYDRSRLVAMKESEAWSKDVDQWNALSSAERGKRARPVLKTPRANKVRAQSIRLYNELEVASRGKDQGRSMMIARDEVLFYLAMTYSDMGNNKKAIPYFEELTTRYPKSEKTGLAKLSLADAYFENNVHRKALPLYLGVAASSSAEFAKLKPYATYRAAWCYSNLLDYKKATLAFLKTIELSKNDKSPKNISFVREAYGDLAMAFALSGQYNDGWAYFREKVRNRELLEKYELTAAQVAKDRGHYKIAEFFYNKLLTRSPEASFARDLALDRAENAKKSNNLTLYAQKLGELLRDYGAGSTWLRAQKLDSTSEKVMVDELVSLVRRDTKDFHKAAQKRGIPSVAKRVIPMYETYLTYVPAKNPDTAENVHEMKFYFADLLYESGEFARAGEAYANVGEGKYSSTSAFNRILAYREAAKKDKKYSDELIAATNDFVSKYPDDKRAGDLMYASANESFESGAQEQSMQTLRSIVTRFASTDRGVDAAERILFIHEKNKNYDAVIGEANAFLANSTLMATGGSKFKANLDDVKEKATFKKIEAMPEGTRAQLAAKGAAYLEVSAVSDSDLKEKSLNNAIVFFKKAEDKEGADKAEAALLKAFPKSKFAKNIYLNQADDLLEKADFDQAIRQYQQVLSNYKGSSSEREKILGNLFYVKAHLEDAVIPELRPTKSLSANTVKLGKDYLKEFNRGSNRDFAVTVLVYRRGATLSDIDKFSKEPRLSSKTKTLLKEAEPVLKVRAKNSSSYPGILKRFPPNPSYSDALKSAMGEAAFNQVEKKYQNYRGLRVSTIPKRIAATLGEKVKSLELLEKSYTAVVSYGDETYALRSLERLSDLYKDLSEELAKISDPDAKKELAPFVKSFDDKSRSLIELCLDKTKELKIKGPGAASCRAKAKWVAGVQALASKKIPDLQWIPNLNHKRPLTEFAEKSFKQNKIGSFILASDLLEKSSDKMSDDEKFYMDFLGALFDWREGRGASAESTLLDLSTRTSGNNKRTVVKNLSSLYLQVNDYKQAMSILSGVDEDSDVRVLKDLARIGMNDGKGG